MMFPVPVLVSNRFCLGFLLALLSILLCSGAPSAQPGIRNCNGADFYVDTSREKLVPPAEWLRIIGYIGGQFFSYAPDHRHQKEDFIRFPIDLVKLVLNDSSDPELFNGAVSFDDEYSFSPLVRLNQDQDGRLVVLQYGKRDIEVTDGTFRIGKSVTSKLYYNSINRTNPQTGLEPWMQIIKIARSRWCDASKCTATSHRDARECHCFQHLNITLGNIVQLTVYNMGDGGKLGKGYAHPFHLHGTHFYIMKTGYANYDEDGMVTTMNADIPCTDLNTKCNGLKWTDPSWLNGNVHGMHKRPVSKDTLVIPAGGYVVLRFRATNAGWFFAHCHLELHSMGGMAFAMKVGTHEQMAKPPKNFPRECGDYEPKSVAHLKAKAKNM